MEAGQDVGNDDIGLPTSSSAASLAGRSLAPVFASGTRTEPDYFFWEQYGHWCFSSFKDVSALLRDKRFGRAYLDEGKPSLAAVAFYNNYKDRPSGARAPHSLMYMGVALDKLGRKADACKAFRELDDVYGDKAPQDVRTDAAAAKAKAGC